MNTGNTVKLFGVIAILAVIGFSITGCDDGKSGNNGNNGGESPIENDAFFTFTITFEQITDAAPSITVPEIHLSSANGQTTATLIVDNPQQYSSIEWYINGRYLKGEGGSFTLNSADIAYNNVGKHTITIEVIKDGVSYNRNITFTVAE